MNRTIRTIDDVLALMDRMFASDADRWTGNASTWWDGFYADRSKPVPFFVPGPDESLVSYLDRGCCAPGGRWTWGAGPAGTPSTWRRSGSRWTRWTCRLPR
ncbi:hypothetical protein ACFQQB_61400 [Nonomuraea rubra]|uniref:hypothetical protein n=1 Tax=Nonomuraea rubra TaxID=46180 RepID=UPI00361EE7FE